MLCRAQHLVSQLLLQPLVEAQVMSLTVSSLPLSLSLSLSRARSLSLSHALPLSIRQTHTRMTLVHNTKKAGGKNSTVIT